MSACTARFDICDHHLRLSGVVAAQDVAHDAAG